MTQFNKNKPKNHNKLMNIERLQNNSVKLTQNELENCFIKTIDRPSKTEKQDMLFLYQLMHNMQYLCYEQVKFFQALFLLLLHILQ